MSIKIIQDAEFVLNPRLSILMDVALPHEKKMFKISSAVDKNPHLQKHFYPLLISYLAGKKFQVNKFVGYLALARLEYVAYCEQKQSDEVVNACNLDLTKYIKVLIPNSMAQTGALCLHAKLTALVPPSYL
jgi:hypothetical protein